jgi:photosystem II PsbU protein
MKALVRILAVVLVVFSCFSYGGQAWANTSLNPMDVKLTTEFGKKIDLNNSDIRDFRELRGFYPNLASKIIKNAPYDEVDDVLNISGLSATQQTRLQANLDKFTVTEPSKELIEGDDRINPGVY